MREFKILMLLMLLPILFTGVFIVGEEVYDSYKISHQYADSSENYSEEPTESSTEDYSEESHEDSSEDSTEYSTEDSYKTSSYGSIYGTCVKINTQRYGSAYQIPYTNVITESSYSAITSIVIDLDSGDRIKVECPLLGWDIDLDLLCTGDKIELRRINGKYRILNFEKATTEGDN